MSPVQRATQHDAHTYVLDALGSRIANGDLAAGTVLTLADLEEEYQVSRTVIREVVRVLESQGMLVSRRRVGVTVQPIASWDVLDASVIQWRLSGPGSERQLAELMELRSAVEPVAARLAADRASGDQRQRLVELAAVLESLGRRELGDSAEFLDADIAFHTLLLEASGNPLLAQLSSPVAEVLAGRGARHPLSGVPEAGTLEGHVEVAAAIKGGDSAAAGEAVARLVQIISDEIRHRPADAARPASAR